jgi:hypothetical protein
MLDFFAPEYQEPPLNNRQFGLCDDEDGTPAYTDKMNQKKWVAKVENQHSFNITFTAIDKNVIKDDEYKNHERCDGMLTTNTHLYFVELKYRKKGWMQNGISQIESTIELFDKAHPGKKNQYKYKKAYVCNKKHPYFQVMENDQMIKFFQNYRFCLDIQAAIIFKP